MEGKDSVVKILKSITELEISFSNSLLVDYLMGNLTKQITQRGLENTENFGCGDENDEEDYWNAVLEKMIEEGHIKSRSEGIAITAKGKKFLKKPTSFTLEEKEEVEQVGNIEGFVTEILNDGSSVKTKAPVKFTTSSRKLALIQAIDRHVALDDYASNHSLDFDEVLDDVESILANGTKLDLNYFGMEVLGDEAIEELFEYYDGAETDALNKAIDEYGDVYTTPELRLGRILWRAGKM